jgi:hypothetical protein
MKQDTNRFLRSGNHRLLLLVVTIFVTTVSAQAAAPVGQTIWIRAAANGLFVSADQNRGAWAPLVADRPSVQAWEQFTVVDAGGGFYRFQICGHRSVRLGGSGACGFRAARR